MRANVCLSASALPNQCSSGAAQCTTFIAGYSKDQATQCQQFATNTALGNFCGYVTFPNFVVSGVHWLAWSVHQTGPGVACDCTSSAPTSVIAPLDGSCRTGTAGGSPALNYAAQNSVLLFSQDPSGESSSARATFAIAVAALVLLCLWLCL